jgi:nucleoside-diphosphate-sugar epimerase
MGRSLLLTGASGALGPAILAELRRAGAAERLAIMLRPGSEGVAERGARLARRAAQILGEGSAAASPRLVFLEGDVRREGLGLDPAAGGALQREIDGVVHAAAETSFRAPREDLLAANEGGTRHLLAWAGDCPRLRQVVLLSTVCAAGTATGRIAEAPLPAPPGFVNAYEESKWRAERAVERSGVPAQVLRLGTAVGSERTGAVERFGAVHYALAWLFRGLVPMLPGSAATPVDLISNELAAGAVERALARAPGGYEVYHVAAGERAPRLADLLALLVEEFARRRPAWRRRQIEPPRLVSEAVYTAFGESVARSGNPLFTELLAALDSFLPALRYPKIYGTARAEELWGGPLPLPDWQTLLARVLDFCLASGWPGSEPTP